MARQNFIGVVVSQGRMQKTVKVRVETKIFNKRINKDLLNRKDYLVHDEDDISREGDMVRIESTRPLSKRKSFAIAEILKNKGQQFAKYEMMAKENVLKDESIKTKEFLDRRLLKEQESKSNNSNLIKDIRTIQLALRNRNNGTVATTADNIEEIKRIKEKYGIKNFTPNTVKEILNLDIIKLEESILNERKKLESVQLNLKEMIKHEDKSNIYLEDHGIQDPISLQKNIKKNMLRKFLMKDANF